MMSYEARKFDHLIGTPGFSDDLLKNHFALYEGYVTNTNTLLELLKEKKAGTPEFNELKRRFGWEFNGMRLHELYFGNMSKTPTKFSEESALFKKTVESFGSGDASRDDFVGVGTMRGIGWTIFTYDPVASRLLNVWVNEHDVGLLAGTFPIVVLDCFEHAYMRDYGLKRADYIMAFLSAIDWNVAERRFQSAISS